MCPKPAASVQIYSTSSRVLANWRVRSSGVRRSPSGATTTTKTGLHAPPMGRSAHSCFGVLGGSRLGISVLLPAWTPVLFLSYVEAVFPLLDDVLEAVGFDDRQDGELDQDPVGLEAEQEISQVLLLVRRHPDEPVLFPILADPADVVEFHVTLPSSSDRAPQDLHRFLELPRLQVEVVPVELVVPFRQPPVEPVQLHADEARGIVLDDRPGLPGPDARVRIAVDDVDQPHPIACLRPGPRMGRPVLLPGHRRLPDRLPESPARDPAAREVPRRRRPAWESWRPTAGPCWWA